MKTRILSCFLVFCMIFTMLPVSALAAGNSELKTTVAATIQHDLDSSGKETGQMTARIEAYMTDKTDQTRTVKPCDIIFLIEQSQFMNTTTGSADSGDERAEILNAMERLLKGMPKPTTGGEHRIAIAGYGRINNPGHGDSYEANLYPGTRPSSNPSLNTGYYTCVDGGPAFQSQGGWTEWSSVTGGDRETLPQLPSGYLNDSTQYNSVFMSFDDAEKVINVDEMVPWYAGAARMDAGLAITEQLAKIAQANKNSSAKSGEDRNLIICIAASSLPYENFGSHQELRPEAAIAAAKTLKETYGATIFGLGDFHKLELKDESLNGYDAQRDNFNSTMAKICGNQSTNETTGAEYFKGLSQVHNIDQALNELMTKIDASVGADAAVELNINVDKFTEVQGGDVSSLLEYEWNEIKTNHHILPAGSIREVASVDYYRFTGYVNEVPQFESEPSRHTELNLADIGSGDSIRAALKILPIPPQAQDGEIAGTNYGEKVVITITDPVCIDYEWVGRWAPTFQPPAHEHAARGMTHKPAKPTQNDVSGTDLHLKFGGWYRLWDDAVDKSTDRKDTWVYDGQTYVKYTGTVFPAFGNDLKLYGRWLPEIHVSFHWVGSVIPEDENGGELEPPSALTFPLNENGTYQYTAAQPEADGYEFDGWYKDAACTQKFAEGGEALTSNTNLYGRWTRLGTQTVTFKVQNGHWNTESEWYNSHNTTVDSSDGSVTVQVPLRNGKGTLKPEWVPSAAGETTDMTPSEGYKAPGAWDTLPNTNTDGITEEGNYTYTYTFPETNKYTITYHWTSDTTEVPDGVALPTQQTGSENQEGGKPSFTIASVSTNDEKWHFSGWNTADDLKGTTHTGGSSYTFSNDGDGDSGGIKNLNLYGQWKHADCKVIFAPDYFSPGLGTLNTTNNDDGTWSCEIPYGSSLTEENTTLPIPIPGDKTRYFFRFWDMEEVVPTDEPEVEPEVELEDEPSDEPAGKPEKRYYTNPEVLDMTVRTDLTFTAQWWPVVTFDANGGAWGENETKKYVGLTSETNGIEPMYPPIFEDHTFLGWRDKNGAPVDFETINADSGAMTLYAHWAEHATVTFRIINGTWSGGSTEDKTVSVVLYPQADGSASGTLNASYVPQIMIPAPGYENTTGYWEREPNTERNGITGDVTYIYRFGSTSGGGGGSVTTKYTLTYESNGGTAYQDERYERNTTVKLDKVPAREGYQFTGWYADKELTQKLSEIKMTSDKTVYAGWKAATVPGQLNGDDHFAYVVGYPDGSVGPKENITRAETATIFFRLLKEDVRDGNLTYTSGFEDVESGAWYSTPVCTMAELGIVKGRTETTFAPTAPITRAEFAAICARFDTGLTDGNSNFTDISGHWAEKEIERAATLGWVQGDPDGRFRPNAYITRAEAMTMINRVLCRIPETESDLLNGMNVWPDNQPGAWYYLAVQEATNSHDFERKGEVFEKWTALTEDPDWSRYEQK